MLTPARKNFFIDNPVSRYVRNVIGSIEQFFVKRFNENELKELLADVPEERKPLFQQVLRNQQASYDAQSFLSKPLAARRTERRMQLEIAKKAFTNMRDLFAMIGVQPMSGPVGLVYTLGYKTASPDHLLGGPDNIQEAIRLEIYSNAVTAASRRLQAAWTLEAVQDVVRSHDIDLEKELPLMVGHEVSTELSYEVISDLIKLAKQNDVIQVSSTDDVTRYGRMLAVSLNQAANGIAKSTRRGCGNFILTTPNGLIELAGLDFGLVFEPTKTDSSRYGDVMFAGVIKNSDTVVFKVYIAIAPALTELERDGGAYYIVGYKGSGEADTGYFYTPYVPLLNMGIMVDPDSFQPVQRFATRYGKLAVTDASGYYRLVRGSLMSSLTKSDPRPTPDTQPPGPQVLTEGHQDHDAP